MKTIYKKGQVLYTTTHTTREYTKEELIKELEKQVKNNTGGLYGMITKITIIRDIKDMKKEWNNNHTQEILTGHNNDYKDNLKAMKEGK